MPHVSVDFRGAELVGITEITSLDAPHRVYDAILRDSSLDGKPFMKSELGIRLAGAKPTDATALLETSPTALLFGAWHSTGEGGGFGAKFPRTLVSEIIAVDVPVEDGPTDARTGEVEIRTAGRRTGSRIDPLGVLRRVEVFKGQDGWDVVKERAGKGAKQVRPSEINHGNIAPTVRPMTNGSVGAPPVFQHGTFELMGRWNIARDGTGTVSVDFMQGGNIIESDVFRVVSSDAAGTRFWLISTHPTVGGVVVPELVSAEAVRLR